jgi:hypothetical protein
MNILFIIATNDAETVYNAMRLANVAVEKGDEVNVFMLGKGVLFEQISNEQFNAKEQIDKFKGNMYVWGVCMKAHGLVGTKVCPIGYMNDLYESVIEADKVLTF